jgi:hypothetical protein
MLFAFGLLVRYEVEKWYNKKETSMTLDDGFRQSNILVSGTFHACSNRSRSQSILRSMVKNLSSLLIIQVRAKCDKADALLPPFMSP